MKQDKINRIKSNLLWTLAMAVIAVLFIASVQRKMNASVSNTVVVIKPIKGNNDLIREDEILKKFKDYLGFDISTANLKDLDLMEMESILNEDERVKISHLFMDGRDHLNIWVIQKQPVVRIMDGSHMSYYLDEDGQKLDLVKGSAIRVPIATGHIDLYSEDFLTSEKAPRLREVFEIARHISEDETLRPLIEQIDVESSDEIVLIPKIGRHELTLGDARDLDDKFNNLKIMYREGLPREGWRKFSVLKLNFKGQVVAQVK